MLWIPFLAQGSLWDSVKFQFQDRLSPSGMDASPDSTGVLEISTSWTVLGPFQIGTREAAWGSDPLEYYGGFSSLTPESHPTISSSVGSQGEARWSEASGKLLPLSTVGLRQSSQQSLRVSFPQTDWQFLQRIYGWSATQWQAWARGEIVVKPNIDQPIRQEQQRFPVLLFSENVVEFVVDGTRHWGGDFFSYRRAPLLLWLTPGSHVIDVRLVRDVRSMGGLDNDPAVTVNLEARLAIEELEVREGSVLVSDVIDGTFVSAHASVGVTNTAASDIFVTGMSALDGAIDVELDNGHLGKKPIRLVDGQTRPLRFRVTLLQSNAQSSTVTIHYHIFTEKNLSLNTTFELSIRHSSLHSPHKMTHLHPSGIVSFSLLRAPALNATCVDSSNPAPGLVMLHGAGVNVDSTMMRNTFDQLQDVCAWVICPSGVTTWSGDDWHTWGWADVANSIYYILVWIETMKWKGVAFDIEKLLFTGHSNGGQGVWYALTHYPQAIAAAPASGYLSIQSYVSYNLWGQMDPAKLAVQQGSLANYRHELLAPMVGGVPVYQQHGGDDDNVPAYHSRLMHQMIGQAGWKTNYSELAGKGHWWEGVMTTPGLVEFYKHHLNNPKLPSHDQLDSFEIVVADPFSTFYKFGVRVLYLQEPGQLGRMRVRLDKKTNTWRFEPENIMMFEIEESAVISSVEIDDPYMNSVQAFTIQQAQRREFRRMEDSTWIMDDKEQKDRPIRQPHEFGGLDALLRPVGGREFTIRYTKESVRKTAVQISRNLHQYFAADTAVLHDSKSDASSHGYSISISAGECGTPPCGDDSDFPIQISPDSGRLRIRNSKGQWARPGGSSTKLGAIFLRPTREQGLELAIWGETEGLLEQATRLMPMMTGTGQPDFIIVREDSRWRGVDGTYLGFFDAWWNVSRSSVLG